jgi:4-hydroxybenzoate polyprenyltransferase
VRLKYIILLSRPLNLVIVAITMYITRYIVLTDVLHKRGEIDLIIKGVHFSALVLAALLITAAGNVINDYFDQKVDKINKPNKVIVGKTVNRKMAILIHQGLNGIALSLSIWVASVYHFWQLLFIPLTIMFLLWWYSPLLKKKPFVGNLLVAICTAAVPVFASITDLYLLRDSLKVMTVNNTMALQSYSWLWVLGISAFAFVLTMIREAVKDAEDVPGDRSERYQTLPIVWGMKRTKLYVSGWMIVYFLMVSWCMSRLSESIDFAWITGCLILPMLIAALNVYRASMPGDFSRVSRWIKFAMVGGLLLMIVLL